MIIESLPFNFALPMQWPRKKAAVEHQKKSRNKKKEVGVWTRSTLMDGKWYRTDFAHGVNNTIQAARVTS